MSFFQRLLGKPKSKNTREIVYYFADILGQINNLILDETLLRYTKEELYFAFDYYIATLEAMANPGLVDEIRQVQTLRLSIADFQPIDAADKAIVSEINAGRRFAKFRNISAPHEIKKACNEDPETFKILYDIQTKYQSRSLAEMTGRA